MSTEEQVLQKAVRLEWITLATTAVNVTLVGLVAGQSQAMRAAWLEDMLAFLPPIAFLIAVRIIRRPPSGQFPYGYHRAIGVGHLVAATALLFMGGLLLFTSTSGLIAQERPPIGITVLFGHDIWAGWLMVAVMAVSGVAPVILGRMKLKLAEQLHDKLLRADADMLKADWTTALATIIGVLGIGVGLWWMDAAAAIVVSLSIVWDGVTNLKAAVGDLVDERAMRFDDSEPHFLIDAAEARAHTFPWVSDARARVRDQGHVFHVELFVVPHRGQDPTVSELDRLRRSVESLDWKLHDVVIVPAPSLTGMP